MPVKNLLLKRKKCLGAEPGDNLPPARSGHPGQAPLLPPCGLGLAQCGHEVGSACTGSSMAGAQVGLDIRRERQKRGQ